MRSGEDISGILISDESIRQKLPSIFVDSMVVDQHFNIVVISQNVLEFLEFNTEEIKHKSLNYLTGNCDLVSVMKNELTQGYFEERKAFLFSKSNRKITVGISGFYLGLISDINGYIILRITNLDEVEVINQQLQQKKAELDNFIYRTAHDLRGPLATIKGLINLLKMNAGELDRLLPMIDAHANKLDERLFQLVYLAKADLEVEAPSEVVDFNTIETTLRRIIEQNAFVDFLQFHFNAPTAKLMGVNEALLSSLLSNLLFHILSQPMSSLDSIVFFRINREGNVLKVTVGTQGFTTNDLLAKTIRNDEFLYTDLVNYPQFLNFYAVQKIAWKLKARIRINFISSERQRITVLVPIR
ncbi:MAG TPA: histidine kinase dimerization/phospho-acceptor domain-containing protein [Chryseolinea sp.]